MNCLPCFKKKDSEEKKTDEKKSDEEVPVAQPKEDPLSKQPSDSNIQDESSSDDNDNDGDDDSLDDLPTGSARRFKYNELASATENFELESLLGESRNGKVYKGTLADDKVVAIKKLKKRRTKAKKEFIEEVNNLVDHHHPNLVELMGYCVDFKHRILVYEYMPMGSINDHLHDLPPGKKPLDWIRRMKVAVGTAKAMEHLHESLDPPIICGNVRSTNILLDKNFDPKVTDYGFVNLECSSGSNVHKSVIGTVGCAPESESSGELTTKSHVYSFGVVLLELITGRKAVDTSQPTNEQKLVSWAQPYIKDPNRFQELSDPMFKGVAPEKNINKAVEVVAMCLQDEWRARPFLSDILGSLSLLTLAHHDELGVTVNSPPKKYPSSSSSSSSSDSDSDTELNIKIEPFNRPEPDDPRPESVPDSESEREPELEPQSEHEAESENEPESEHEPEWESETDTDTDTEPEPEPEPDPEPELDSIDSDSSSDSDSSPEPVSKLEPVPEPMIELVSKPEIVPEPEPSPSHKDKSGSDNDSHSSSGKAYGEDAYIEGESSGDDKANTSILLNSKSKARMKTQSSKKKVVFKIDENESTKPVSSSYIKKTKSTRKSDSRGDDHSDIEFADDSDDEFEPHRFKSTISRFGADSRSYSGYQDDESVDGSSSEGKK